MTVFAGAQMGIRDWSGNVLSARGKRTGLFLTSRWFMGTGGNSLRVSLITACTARNGVSRF